MRVDFLISFIQYLCTEAQKGYSTCDLKSDENKCEIIGGCSDAFFSKKQNVFHLTCISRMSNVPSGLPYVCTCSASKQEKQEVKLITERNEISFEQHARLSRWVI